MKFAPHHIALLGIAATSSLYAQASLHGTVQDPLGAAVPNARVELLQGATVVLDTTADATGHYTLPLPHAGRYEVRASAPTFEASTTPSLFLGASHDAALNLTLATPTLSQQVTVTANGTPTPLAQSGAPITVLDHAAYLDNTELQQPLRLVPGIQITQTGQTGGTTALFIRGGQSTYNKVLLDGVPLNDVGGNVNFANYATVGVSQIEILRQPNSALYGSDALAGVISLTSTRGASPLPLLTYAVDGGNFSTVHQLAELSGAHSRFDYYNGFSRFQTANNEPNDQFGNSTFAGNYGFTPDARTGLRFTFRHLATNSGTPNAIALYGIPDFANSTEHDTFFSATAQRQTTLRWHNLLRYGHEKLASSYDQYAPNGTLYTPPSDPGQPPNYPNGYIGNQVTITGANGFTVSGQALLDYITDYPSQFVGTANRDFVYAETDYSLNSHTTLLGAFNYDAERGTNLILGFTSPGVIDPFYDFFSAVDRRNQSYTLQLTGDLHSRLFYTLGSGIEHNQLYGNALTPRVSLAYYAVRPSTQSFFSGTKLHGSFGKGVKDASVGEQNGSLYTFLQQNAPTLIAQDGIAPIGAEYSRNYDAGLEQQFGDGRARINVSYFHNEFTHGIQYVPGAALLSLGVPPATAALASNEFIYVNSQAYRSEGLELESEFRLAHHLFARAGYTYVDAVVQHSFSSDALSPSFNTASNFATLPIGVYAPLDGARPFRIAPHSGYFALAYARAKFDATLNGSLVGRRDDSTFLSDKDFGSSLLLPNRNLDGSYQRLELTANYRINPHLATYVDMQNLLNQSFAEAFGYPALPFNLRGGVKFSFGGESFHLR